MNPLKSACASMGELMYEGPNNFLSSERMCYDGSANLDRRWWPYKVCITGTYAAAQAAASPGNAYVRVYRFTGAPAAWDQIGSTFSYLSAGYTNPEAGCYYQSDTNTAPNLEADCLNLGEEFAIGIYPSQVAVANA
jgi:hypothetical protein